MAIHKPMKVRTKTTNENKYSGNLCPNCGSKYLLRLNFVPDKSGIVLRPVDCDGCKARWTEVYKLKGIADLYF